MSFLKKLKTNTLKPSLGLKGIVKKSDKDTEVLFARKGDFGNWVKIPLTMIESVIVLKNFTKENETYTVVKLHLKTPETSKKKVLHELLSSSGNEETCAGKYGWKNKLMERFGCCKKCGHLFGIGAGFFKHHCGCGCHQEHHEEFEPIKLKIKQESILKTPCLLQKINLRFKAGIFVLKSTK